MCLKFPDYRLNSKVNQQNMSSQKYLWRSLRDSRGIKSYLKKDAGLQGKESGGPIWLESIAKKITNRNVS